MLLQQPRLIKTGAGGGFITGIKIAGRTAPLSGDAQGPSLPSPPVRPSAQADKCGAGQAPPPVPSRGPGPPRCPWTAGQHVGVIRPGSSALPLPGAPSGPIGEITPVTLQIWNCSAAISLLQLDCPRSLPGWVPSGDFRPSTEVSQPWRKAAFTWYTLPCRRGTKARGPHPPAAPSQQRSLLSCTCACGPAPEGTRSRLHTSQPSPSDPFPTPPIQWQRARPPGFKSLLHHKQAVCPASV